MSTPSKKISIRRKIPITKPQFIKRKVEVSFIILDSGTYLYDDSTRKLYDVTSPHKYIGVLDDHIKEKNN